MYPCKSFLVAAFAAAGVFLLAPSFARADITIQVEEVTAGGNAVGAPILVSTPTGTSLSTGPQSTTNFTIGNVSTNLTSLANGNYVSSALDLSLSSFNSTDGLAITITYTGLPNVNPTTTATVTNQASSTNTTSPPTPSSTFTVTSTTSVSDTSSNVLATTGSSIASATNLSGGSGLTTSGSISSLPGTYSMTQTITAYVAVPGGTTVTGGVGGAVSSDLIPGGAVPAPGGLALVAIGLPLLGLRRVFGRRANA